MADLAKALKEEIRRLARKEIKVETDAARQAMVRCRREIAGLKRLVREQQRTIAALSKQQRKQRAQPQASETDSEKVRFSARSVAAQRKRLALSAARYAQLVGVSALTVYNWENGKTRPRQEQLAALVALRGIGKKEAQRRLDLLGE